MKQNSNKNSTKHSNENHKLWMRNIDQKSKMYKRNIDKSGQTTVNGSH